MKDKRCTICKAVFTPNCNKQIYCEECRPYMLRYKDEKKAKGARWADAKRERKHLSDYPAADGCEGCCYWRFLNAGTGGKACHYALDNARLRPCHPGKNCTVRIDRKGKVNA